MYGRSPVTRSSTFLKSGTSNPNVYPTPLQSLYHLNHVGQHLSYHGTSDIPLYLQISLTPLFSITSLACPILFAHKSYKGILYNY